MSIAKLPKLPSLTLGLAMLMVTSVLQGWPARLAAEESPLRQASSNESGASFGWKSGSLVGATVASEQPWQAVGDASGPTNSQFWMPASESSAGIESLDRLSSLDHVTSKSATSDDSAAVRAALPLYQCQQRRGPNCGPTWQILPQGLIYRAYLAGEKESRMRGIWNYDNKDGWIWDISLGGRAGILRYGTAGDARPEGFQLDIEGAGLVRLDIEQDRDVDAADFRFGLPLTYGTREYQIKFAYYHLSSHLGDEFVLKTPGFPRLNYSRDEFVLGGSYYTCPELRFYAEAGWAFLADVAEPWEFQFGVDYAPAGPTGIHGAPFVALNGHLRQEVDFGGNLVAQAGWAWRRSEASGMFRAGVQYFNGQSEQFSFYNRSESKVGMALWYDY